MSDPTYEELDQAIRAHAAAMNGGIVTEWRLDIACLNDQPGTGYIRASSTPTSAHGRVGLIVTALLTEAASWASQDYEEGS